MCMGGWGQRKGAVTSRSQLLREATVRNLEGLLEEREGVEL